MSKKKILIIDSLQQFFMANKKFFSTLKEQKIQEDSAKNLLLDHYDELEISELFRYLCSLEEVSQEWIELMEKSVINKSIHIGTTHGIGEQLEYLVALAKIAKQHEAQALANIQLAQDILNENPWKRSSHA
jgi:hypothetical protein